MTLAWPHHQNTMPWSSSNPEQRRRSPPPFCNEILDADVSKAAPLGRLVHRRDRCAALRRGGLTMHGNQIGDWRAVPSDGDLGTVLDLSEQLGEVGSGF